MNFLHWNSVLCYHERIGYTYTPSIKSRLPCETGGYLLRTNAAGFRSDREFVKERLPGTFRAILFGDSMTAGDGVSNSLRFSDLIEKAVPGLEVFNFALTSSGTDQHYLAYTDCANVDHDLLIICVNVENISRVNARFLTFHDDKAKAVFYAKPYYEIDNDELVLHHVPVPKQPWTEQTLPPEDATHVDWGAVIFPRTQALLRRLVSVRLLRRFATKIGIKDLMQKVMRFKRITAYDAPDNPEWLLFRKVIETWIRGSQTPVLLVPIPMWAHFDGTSDPTSYQARFNELASDTGCFLHDPLPDLLANTPEDRRSFRFERDVHFTPKGHHVMAQSIVPTIERIIRENQQ